MTPQPELDEYEIKSQPAFNVPGIILLLAVAMVVCQLMTGWISNDAYRAVLLNFAFIPLAYIENAPALPVPYARYWTPVTYAFLHGGWAHLIVNLVWMFAFGSAVARRFGLVRFLLFFALSALASALMHVAFNWGSNVPVIGASGVVSACMGAAVRFGFAPNDAGRSFHGPALTLVQSLNNRTAMTFIIVWFALNWLFGSGVVPLAGATDIAWEAHMGGFLFGLLAFWLFEPRRNSANLA